MRSLARNGLLLTLACTFSYLESLIPTPVGVRLGLSNLVILYSLYCQTIRATCAIDFLKCTFVAITRGFSAGILSSAGFVLSICGMLLLQRCHASLLLTSACGGLLHNLGQLAMAMLLMQSIGLLGYLPVLLLSGTVAGMLSAILAGILFNRLPDSPIHIQFPNRIQKRRSL